MISCCKYTTSILHEPSDRKKLIVRKTRPDVGIPGVGAVLTIVAEHPDLVIRPQIRNRCCEIKFPPDGGIEIAVTVGGIEEDFGIGAAFQGLDDVGN